MDVAKYLHSRCQRRHGIPIDAEPYQTVVHSVDLNGAHMVSRTQKMASMAFVVFTLGTFGQTPKFRTFASGTLNMGCGNGLDDNSANCSCVRVEGVSVSKCASGGHICARLPDSLTGSDVRLAPSAAVGGNALTGFASCEGAEEDSWMGFGWFKYIFAPVPGPCKIGWSRYEGKEYYPDTHQVCGRFKNWSADRDITMRIEVQQR